MQTLQEIDFSSRKENEKNFHNENQLENNSLDETLNEIHHCLIIALDNQFEEALNITQEKSQTSIYHSLAHTFLLFLKAVLTLEKKQIDLALQSTNQLYQLSSNHKFKRSTFSYLCNIWSSSIPSSSTFSFYSSSSSSSPSSSSSSSSLSQTSQQSVQSCQTSNVIQYTDIQAHAELCYAESLLMYALLTFLENQNLINLLKAAFRFKSCYHSYKQCSQILQTKTNWDSDQSKQNFQTGVLMGLGTFNLFLSHLPSKVIKILTFIGFNPAARSTGLKYLDDSIHMKHCLRSPISVLINATYHCYIEHYFGLGNSNISYIDNVLKSCLEQFPNSAFFLLFNGRLNLLKGQLEKAIKNFNQCIQIQHDWKQLHNICYWELLWCYSIQCDWNNALKYSNILREQCAWSPAIYTYLSAIFLHQIYEEKFIEFSEEKKNQMKLEFCSLYKQVPNLRIRFAGKTIPAEKFAITNAEKFFHNNQHLILPAIEYIYIWNIFPILEKNVSLVEPILKRINFKLSDITSNASSQANIDDLCILLLLKGVALRTIHLPNQAVTCFQQILEYENKISLKNNFILPFCVQELALTYIHLEDFDLANFWYEKAKKDYSNYLLETLLHFRIHCGQRLIQQKISSKLTLTNSNTTSLTSLTNTKNCHKEKQKTNSSFIQEVYIKNESKFSQNKI